MSGEAACHRGRLRTENEVSQNCVQEPDWKLEGGRESKSKATAGQRQRVWGEECFPCLITDQEKGDEGTEEGVPLCRMDLNQPAEGGVNQHNLQPSVGRSSGKRGTMPSLLRILSHACFSHSSSNHSSSTVLQKQMNPKTQLPNS